MRETIKDGKEEFNQFCKFPNPMHVYIIKKKTMASTDFIKYKKYFSRPDFSSKS